MGSQDSVKFINTLFYLAVFCLGHSLFGMFFTAFMFHTVVDSLFGLFFGLVNCLLVFNTKVVTDCLYTICLEVMGCLNLVDAQTLRQGLLEHLSH